MLELVDRGKDDLISRTMRNRPYLAELMETAGNVRGAELDGDTYSLLPL